MCHDQTTSNVLWKEANVKVWGWGNAERGRLGIGENDNNMHGSKGSIKDAHTVHVVDTSTFRIISVPVVIKDLEGKQIKLIACGKSFSLAASGSDSPISLTKKMNICTVLEQTIIVK